MLRTIKGTYNNGMVELLEMPSEIQTQTDVFVIFFIPEIIEQEESGTERLYDPKLAVTAQLSALLRRVQKSFPLQDEYVVYLEKFVQIVNEKLLAIYEHGSHNHLRLVVLLKTALRRLHTIELTDRHLELFEQIISLLAGKIVTSTDILDFQKKLRGAGIETLMNMERQYTKLVELYEEDNVL